MTLPISHLTASPLSHTNGPNWLRAGNSPEDGWALQLLYGGWTPGDALLAHLTASPLSHRNGPIWLRAGNLPEDGWALQLFHGGWTPGVTLSLFTSPQVHYPPEWPELASSREFARRWVGCATSLRGVDSRCDALLAHLSASPLSHPNGPNWLRAGNSSEDGWAVQLLHGGWTPGSDALLAHLSASPLSHPNGPNWLRAGNLPEDGWAVQPLHGGWTPVVTLFLLTSPQVHYPTRMARIGFEQGIRPKMGGLCNFSTGVDFRCDAPISHLTASPLSHTNGPNWLRAGNSPEDGWALKLLYGGWTLGDALLAHLTASPLSHRNGPIWLRAGNLPEDGWALHFSTGGGLSV